MFNFINKIICVIEQNTICLKRRVYKKIYLKMTVDIVMLRVNPRALTYLVHLFQKKKILFIESIQ